MVVWGTGTPRREFLYVDDMASGCLHVMNLPEKTIKSSLLNFPKPCFVNLGSGEDLTIREHASIISRIVGFEGTIVFDAKNPDGTPRKLLDTSRLVNLGWQPQIALEEGLKKTYKWFLQFSC